MIAAYAIFIALSHAFPNPLYAAIHGFNMSFMNVMG